MYSIEAQIQKDKIMDLQNQLRKIASITDAYYKGNIVISSEINGYHKDVYGLDVIMATIQNHVIDGLQEKTKINGGRFYV